MHKHVLQFFLLTERLLRGIWALPSPVNQGEFFQPLALLGNKISTPFIAREVYFPQVAKPPRVAAGYRNGWVNATLVENKVREYGIFKGS